LKKHAPFTLFGAATGLVCMFLFKSVGPEINHRLFQVFHPGHVVLSAIVTASLYKLYEGKASIVKILLVGYIGSIGIATLSDCVLPFFGESILGVAIPVHADLHEHDEAPGHILIAYFRPRTRFPHAGHVLISTWASSFHVLMNTHRELTTIMLLGIFAVLFIAVWLPCCISDIVFPLLFVGSDCDLPHGHHH